MKRLLNTFGFAAALLFLLATALIAQTDRQASPQSGSQTWTAPMPEPEVAFDAAVWGMPIVSMHAMREAFFRDAGAEYGDIVYWSKPADWMNQTATPDASSLYVYFNFNTKDGPQVLAVPPASGAGLSGSVLDAWQVPKADVGPAGSDAGQGGRYLLLPPDNRDPVPPDYLPVRFDTYNGYALLRVIPEDASPEAAQRALALVKKLRLYPLGAATTSQGKYIDMAGRLFDGIVRFDRNFYAALARMVDEEPALPRDAEMMANLRTLGIIPGQPFAPNTAAAQLLTAAAEEVQADFTRRAPADGELFYGDRHWRLPAALGGKTGFTFEADGQVDIGARGLFYFVAYAPPKQPGRAAFHLSSFADNDGQLLAGRRNYRLRVPADVPAKQFWSVTVYALETAAFFRGATTISLDSYNPKLQQNGDGSVDIYFGPQAPAGNETNWIYTAPGKRWFAVFRFYDPEQSLLEKTWTLPDIEPVR